MRCHLIIYYIGGGRLALLKNFATFVMKYVTICNIFHATTGSIISPTSSAAATATQAQSAEGVEAFAAGGVGGVSLRRDVYAD